MTEVDVSVHSPRRAPALVHRLLLDGMVAPLARAVARPFEVAWDVDPSSLSGPFVVVANHASHLDTPLILATLPPRLRHHTAPAAAEDYFYRRPLVGAGITALVGAFPFPRSGSRGLERAAALLADGWSVLLFPEGTRSADGRLHRFHSGVAHLLARTGVPALPLALSGTFDRWPRTRLLPRPGPLAIHVGAPWSPPPGLPPCAVARALGARVADLLLPLPDQSPTADRAVGHSRPLAA